MESDIPHRTIYLKRIEFKGNQTASSNLNTSFHFLPNKCRIIREKKENKVGNI